MTGRTGHAGGGGFSVLDGVALVAGASVASVHVREVLARDQTGSGWVVVWGAFAWLALTSAGPFLYLIRRYARKVPGYPGVGDRLWGTLGLPWLLTTVLQATFAGGGASDNGAVNTWLVLGLGITSITALVVVWSTWVMVPPERAVVTFSAPWSNRVGLVLAVAWPVQIAVGMVVIG